MIVLTHSVSPSIITPLSGRIQAGICSPFTPGQKMTAPFAVFFRLPFRTGLIRFYSVMVGCIGQPLKRLAAPGCGTANLIQSTAQYFAVLFGGLSLFTRIHPMLQNKSVQNPQIKSVSLFNVFLHRQLIAKTRRVNKLNCCPERKSSFYGNRITISSRK